MSVRPMTTVGVVFNVMDSAVAPFAVPHVTIDVAYANVYVTSATSSTR